LIVEEPCFHEYALHRNSTFLRPAIPPCMKPEERERMYQLCAMIETEQNRERFLQLIKELNDLLDRKEQRLEERQKL